MGSTLSGLLITLAAIAAAVLALVFIAVPVFKGVGSLLGGVFKAIGWLISHIFEFIFGIVTDCARCLGAIPSLLVFCVLSLMNVVIGRWSAAAHFADAVVKEFKVGAGCIYRAALRRPLKLVWLHGLLEGLEERVPQVMNATPGADGPSKNTGQFPGYTIVGSLRAGGSGAKLYVARPEEKKRESLAGKPETVVIKSFALTDGSSLPQIIRESRSLDSAKSMGHVLDHGLDEHRFHYVMPYIPGDNLGMVTRQLHGEGDSAGLPPAALNHVMTFAEDLLSTLADFHSHGLWHKDVKPENVIVYEGRAHVVDLGLLTPLHSAMTLTTHGTEYFRDPEMVRQALRGVKVHQVDGAKFDIYGAGAVLYFMLENTFPAHGGLSAFSRKSPESLRWIVNRAMADYSKRYETAAEMLADLHYVRTSPNPSAVRPAELPSVRSASDEGFGVAASVVTPVATPAAVAATPAGFGDRSHLGPAFAPAGVPAKPAFGGKLKRPILSVTNWWTGQYAVYQPRPVNTAEPTQRRYVASGMRLPSEEQLRSARTRASELTKQARARVQAHLARRHSKIPAVLWVLALVVVAVPVLVIGSTLRAVPQPNDPQVFVHSGPIPTQAVPAAAPTLQGHRVLLVNSHPAPTSPGVRRTIDENIALLQAAGASIESQDLDAAAELTILLPRWEQNPASVDTDLDALLAKGNYQGVLWIHALEGTGPSEERVAALYIEGDIAGNIAGNIAGDLGSTDPLKHVTTPAATSVPELVGP